MFRARTNSQKPSDELYQQFKQNFPDLGPGSSTASTEPALRAHSLSDALLDASTHPRHFTDVDDLKDHDQTPKGLHDQWRFTPSLMDPNSFAFTSFANQPPGYYTPTPGGMNTLYHSQAGDLHTPGMGMNIGTPLSLPTSGEPLHADSAVDLHQFHPHMVTHQQQFVNPFGQQAGYAPSSFVHQDSGYEAMGDDGSPLQGGVSHSQESLPIEAFSRPHIGSMAAPPRLQSEKFRYHVTLNAPTAMVKHVEEIPITYLNKGQAYSMSIVDTAPVAMGSTPVKYRTYVRVSFEDEQQRAKPSACWQLWKEGRGTNEAHQRGGKLLAVEYVDPNQGGDEETRRPQIELEHASFDGFSVTWTQNPSSGAADCSVAVRFNFLSTDFSHSKGVKGIPVRLCSKTEMISSGPIAPPSNAEVCYCKVKLFRDHGAERKLSNDVAHVKKTIEKLNQQIVQAGQGVGNFGKRKRSESIVGKSSTSNKPGKVPKHKRTWSTSSLSDQGGKASAEEDLHMKLATVQDMFSSTRPVSVLYLKGEEQDDPDLCPVQLSGDAQGQARMEILTRQSTWESKQSTATTPVTSTLVSPTPSSTSIHSPHRSSERRTSGFLQPAPFDPSHVPIDWANFHHPTSLAESQLSSQAPSDRPLKVQKVHRDRDSSGALGGWIDAIDIDSAYQPPSERLIKPIACFYVLIKSTDKISGGEYYRAVYLMRRSVKDLINGICAKCDVNPTRVTRTTRVNRKGLKIMVDEDVVRELQEGQDMVIEFSEVEYEQPVKHEWDSASPGVLVDGDIGLVETSTSSGLEMKLIY